MKQFIPLALTSMLALACEREVPQPPPVASQTIAEVRIPSDLLITLERTKCLGPCPIYVVNVEASGAVTWNGRDHVAVVGERHAQISPDSVGTLLARFEAIGFDTLAPRYCDDAWDMPSSYVTLQRNGAKKCVLLYWTRQPLPGGRIRESEGVYTALEDLACTIDEAAGTSQWIGEPQRLPRK